MMHILDRALIHFFASAGVVVACLFVLRTVERRTKWPWLPHMLQAQLVFVALCVFCGAALREAYDVAQGQTLAKAISDYVSWALGCGCSAWALWRVAKL